MMEGEAGMDEQAELEKDKGFKYIATADFYITTDEGCS